MLKKRNADWASARKQKNEFQKIKIKTLNQQRVEKVNTIVTEDRVGEERDGQKSALRHLPTTSFSEDKFLSFTFNVTIFNRENSYLV